MKLAIKKQDYSFNPVELLRRLGWATIYNRHTGQHSYVQRLTNDFYPRLHLYLDDKPEEYIFNIHLDQKQASYQGQTAHNADYEDNPILGQTIAKLQQQIEHYRQFKDKEDQAKSKQSWLSKLFS